MGSGFFRLLSYRMDTFRPVAWCTPSQRVQVLVVLRGPVTLFPDGAGQVLSGQSMIAWTPVIRCRWPRVDPWSSRTRGYSCLVLCVSAERTTLTSRFMS